MWIHRWWKRWWIEWLCFPGRIHWAVQHHHQHQRPVQSLPPALWPSTILHFLCLWSLPLHSSQWHAVLCHLSLWEYLLGAGVEHPRVAPGFAMWYVVDWSRSKIKEMSSLYSPLSLLCSFSTVSAAESDPCEQQDCSEHEWCGEKDGVYGCLCDEHHHRPNNESYGEGNTSLSLIIAVYSTHTWFLLLLSGFSLIFKVNDIQITDFNFKSLYKLQNTSCCHLHLIWSSFLFHRLVHHLRQ